MKHLTLTFAITAILSCSNFVNAQLYDSPVVGDIVCGVNQDFPDFPDFSAFLVDDVEFTTDVTINAIRIYFTFDSAGDGTPWPADNFGTPFTAILNIFPDDGALDTEDPFAGTIVDVLVEDNDDDGDGFVIITACGLDVKLAAGNYWIGLCPTVEFGVHGQEFHCNGSLTGNGNDLQGSPAFFNNPGGGFGLGSGWQPGSVIGPGLDYDLAMTVYGSGATPGTMPPECPTGGCEFAVGDVNMDGAVDLLDVAPFVALLTGGGFQCEADINMDGAVDLLDVAPFVDLLTGG